MRFLNEEQMKKKCKLEETSKKPNIINLKWAKNNKSGISANVGKSPLFFEKEKEIEKLKQNRRKERGKKANLSWRTMETIRAQIRRKMKSKTLIYERPEMKN